MNFFDIKFLQGTLCEEGWNKVHRQWPLLLQLGPHHQRRRRRRHPFGLDQGLQNRVASHVKELGPELAEQLLPQWPEPLLPGDHQRRPDRHKLRRRSRGMAVRPNFRRRPILVPRPDHRPTDCRHLYTRSWLHV